jgi:hypothetical protein
MLETTAPLIFHFIAAEFYRKLTNFPTGIKPVCLQLVC